MVGNQHFSQGTTFLRQLRATCIACRDFIRDDHREQASASGTLAIRQQAAPSGRVTDIILSAQGMLSVAGKG
jgi:hypothetical protein